MMRGEPDEEWVWKVAKNLFTQLCFESQIELVEELMESMVMPANLTEQEKMALKVLGPKGIEWYETHMRLRKDE